MKTTILDKGQAEQEGFAVFNSGPHLCVEIEDKHTTITVKTPFGKLVTFAFMSWNNDGDGHVECVDIQHHHDGRKNDGGIPIQKVWVSGQGPTFYNSAKTNDPVTLTILDLK